MEYTYWLLLAGALWTGSLKRDAGSRVSAQRNDWLNGGADTREEMRRREGWCMNRGAAVGVVRGTALEGGVKQSLAETTAGSRSGARKRGGFSGGEACTGC